MTRAFLLITLIAFIATSCYPVVGSNDQLIRSTSSSKRSDSSIATSLSAVRPRGYCAASHAMHSASVHCGFNVPTRARAFRSSGLLVKVHNSIGDRSTYHLYYLVVACTEHEQEL